MTLITAFFRLVRWPNLVFIALTQLLYYYCIYQPGHLLRVRQSLQDWPIDTPQIYVLPPGLFWLLLLASVLIAAAGYIINDYFDINIDLINKPQRLVVDKIIQRRAAIIWHWILSLAGIVLSFYVGFKIGKWYIGMANTITVLALVIYSVSLKKKPLSGNVLISLLTAWVILVLYISIIPGGGVTSPPGLAGTGFPDYPKLLRLTLLYSGFAFITTIIREAVKDMEDMEGDRLNGCRTLPLAWGLNAARIYTAVWLMVLIGLLLVLQLYVIQFNWLGGMVYSLVLLVAPLVLLLFKLRGASTPAHFHYLSRLIKAVMLAGILSMLIYWRYATNDSHLF